MKRHGYQLSREILFPILHRSEMGLSAPGNFIDPHLLLGASPVLLEGKMLRGGMGTGMPYWGPIFTQDEIDALIAYLYQFAMKSESAAN